MNEFIEAFYKEVNVGGENPIERWWKLGFLQGIDDEHQIDELVWSFEAMVEYLMSHPDIEEKWGMDVFPMLRRIICGIITEKDDWIDALNRRITPEEFFLLFDNHTVNDLLEHIKNVGHSYNIRHYYMSSFNVFYSLTLCNAEKQSLSLTDFWKWFYDNLDALMKDVKDYVLVIDDIEYCVVTTYCWYIYELLKGS